MLYTLALLTILLGVFSSRVDGAETDGASVRLFRDPLLVFSLSLNRISVLSFLEIITILQ